MAGVIGAYSQVRDDGTVSTDNTTLSSVLSSKNGDKAKNNTTLQMEDFLSLLVAEMQNQDPLEPTNNSEYMGQMATFSQVEATQEMNDNILEQKAASLVGKAVIVATDLNKNGFVGGVVNYWEKINGTIYLGIGDKLYDIADLDTVMDDEYYKKWSGNDENAATDPTDETTDGTTDGTTDEA
ncbi:MAG: flagellar hook assembly protein FlgD [Lachnospira sp.]